MNNKCIWFLIVAYTSYIYGQNETELCSEDSFKEEGDRCRGALRLVEDPQVSEMLAVCSYFVYLWAYRVINLTIFILVVGWQFTFEIQVGNKLIYLN